jgi:hypothetical protein
VSLRFYTVVIDSHDPGAQAHWWAGVLGWEVTCEADDEVVIEAPYMADESRTVPLDERGPGLIFVPVPESETLKNRLHIDLAPGPDDDQMAEVGRLKALGARPLHLGGGPDAAFVILADPEGNEFRVVSARD